MKKVKSNIDDEGVRFKLEKKYKEALKDPEFLALVKSLDITGTVAMENTTKLKESLEEKKNSIKKHHYLDCPNKYKAYVLTPEVTDGFLDFLYAPCSCYKEKEIDSKMTIYNLSENLRKARIEDIYTDDAKRAPIIKAITNFYKNYPEQKKGIYLYGNFGSGKTYILCALLNKLSEKGVSSVITHVPEFISLIKQSFDDGSYSDKVESIKNVEVLLLDDIGAEYLTPWVRDEVLEPLLNYRMDNNLSTFFTSNMSLKELENHLSLDGKDPLRSRRIIDRIKVLSTEIKLVSENRR